jgi:ATP-binding cassette subfamily B multidrug efflux pump
MPFLRIQSLEMERLNRTLIQLLVKQFFEFWYYYVGAFFCLYITHYIQSELPFIAKNIADTISSTSSISVSHLFWLALGIIVFRTSSRLLFFYPARVLQKLLRFELVEKLEASSPYRYKEQSKGQIFQIISSDMEEVRALIGFALLQIANIVIAMFVLVPKLISFNTEILVALIPMLAAFFMFTFIVSTNRKFYRKTQDLQGEVQNFIIESYLGKSTIKNFHSEHSFIDLFKTHSGLELENYYKAGKRISFAIPLVPFGVGLSLIWGAIIIFENNLGATSLILFSGFVFLFLSPLMFLSWIGVVFARSSGAWNRIQEFVTSLTTESAVEKCLRETKSFKEENESFQMQLPFWDVDLEIEVKKGHKTILVAETGHGKTELVQKIAQIFKNNNSKVSFVSQDPYLYNTTILENLKLGHELDQQQLDLAYELLQVFGLDYLAAGREELFNLVVGEDGKRLSGGQAKRVSLIKSLLVPSDIVVWDDPFSSVDVVLEKEILTKLEDLKLLKDKTLILTGHRFTTLQHCNEFYYLHKDKGVVESGEVDNIDKESAVYAHFEKQLI